MQKTKAFIVAHLSVFALLMSFQLQWAKSREIYSDIFLRFCAIYLLSIPLMYLFFQIIHFIQIKVGKSNPDPINTARMLYPLSVFHLQWIQFVSDYKWRYTPVLILSIFTVTIIIKLFTSLRVRKPERSVKEVAFKTSFTQVNHYFIDCLKQIIIRISQALSSPVKISCLVFYPETWILLSMEIILLIKYCAFSTPQPFLFPVNIALTVLLPVLLVQSIKNLTHRIPAASPFLATTVIALYFLLSFFYITEDSAFDYSILLLNYDLMTHKQTFILLTEKFRLQSWIFIFSGMVSIIALCFLRNREKNRTLRLSIKTGLFSSFAYVLLFMIPVNNLDQLKSLFKSVSGYKNQQKVIEKAAATLREPFPYYRSSENVSDSGIKPLPNIILVCLESCNGLLIEKKTDHGKFITPFFNSLIPSGVYIEHFYGNSVQTARGFFTLLTGVPAGFLGKETTLMPELRFRGLPAILSDYGYSTLFMKAYHDLSYDNTGTFMKAAGFHTVLSMTEDMLTEEEKEMCWGWGLQDDIFYRKCFSILDSLHEKQLAENNEKPFFLTTFNVSNHMMFQDIPDTQKYLYPDADAEDFYENYRNSMFLSDSCLRELFAQLNSRNWLQNTIIIIVGDHSFPSGIHSQKNEKGAWEDNFRTPFLVIWKSHLAPSRLSQHAYSQTDLIPTIFDLLDIKPAHHSVGKSIFDEGPRDPVMLSQPYDGIYLVSIQYPFKLVKRLRGNSLQLFNVENDPMERQDLIFDRSMQPVVKKLQGSITGIMINQQLIEQNRLWPVNGILQ